MKKEKDYLVPVHEFRESVHDILESDAGQQIVEKSKKGIYHIVFGRTGILILVLLIQMGILFFLFDRLQKYAFFAYGGLSLFALLVVVIIINRPGNPAFKLAWMVPITIVPVFGALFYLFVELQPINWIYNQKQVKLRDKIRPFNKQEEIIQKKLKEEDAQMANLSKYINDTGEFPIFENGEVYYFPLGEDKFQALVKELQKAEKFIFMEYFIVAEGRMWDTILAILKRKAKEGVEVRFMYDGTCTLSHLPYNYEKKLREEGIQCKVFHPIIPALSTYQNNRDHRKIVVIDGHTAFTGGVNLADEYINEKERFGHWKDTAIMIKGDAVKSFTWMFLQMWDKKHDSFDKYLNVSMPLDIQKQGGYVQPYGDSPMDKENVGELVYMDILNTAKEYVHIMTPYLIIGNEMITALTYAAKRGIDVKIIMPGIPDKKYAFALAKTYYPELIAAGVKIYQYKKGFVHAKEFVSDGRKAVVGTINLDFRSLYLHFECAALLYKVPQIEEIEKDFQETLKECKEITMDVYKEEKITERLFGSMLRLIAPLM